MIAGVTLDIVIASALALVGVSLLFAAAAVVLRVRNAAVAARWQRVEERWEGRILEALSGDSDGADIIAGLRPGEAPYLTEFLARFVRRVTGPERARLRELARPLLPAAAAGLRARSAETRAIAVETLGLLSRPEDTDVLAAALDDPSPLVAMVAARAIAREGTARHAAAMVAHLHRFQEWRPSYLAAMLAAFGPPIAPSLRAALANPARLPRVRTVACDALARLNDAAAAATAAAILAREEDPELVSAALRLLARVGHAEHLPAIRARIHDPSEAVRLAAVRALGALGGPQDVPLLAGSLTDSSRWVAEHAARGLAAGPGRITLASFAAAGGPEALIASEVLQEPAS